MTPPNGTTPKPADRQELVDEIMRAIDDNEHPVTLSTVRREVEEHGLKCDLREFITGLKAQIRLAALLLAMFALAAIGAGVVVVRSEINSAVERGLDKRFPALHTAIEKHAAPQPADWQMVPSAHARQP